MYFRTYLNQILTNFTNYFLKVFADVTYFTFESCAASRHAKCTVCLVSSSFGDLVNLIPMYRLLVFHVLFFIIFLYINLHLSSVVTKFLFMMIASCEVKTFFLKTTVHLQSVVLQIPNRYYLVIPNNRIYRGTIKVNIFLVSEQANVFTCLNIN